MYKSVYLFFVVITVLFMGACAPATNYSGGSKVTVTTIIEMTRSGESDQEIIIKMKDSKTVYKLDGMQYAKLREQGVSDAVIDYMQGTWIDQELKKQNRNEDWQVWDIGDAGY